MVCLPVLKHSLGNERLGVISLAFVVVGYFGLFDFGLSRALTKMVAERVGHVSSAEIPGLIWTSLLLMGMFGIVGAIVGIELAPWFVYRVIRIASPLQHETLIAFYWLSISIPVVVLTAGLRGVLEALQEFRIATAIRVPIGIFMYLGPVLVLPFSRSVASIIAIMVAIRALACIAHLLACLYILPEFRAMRFSPRSSLLSLLNFGGWMTISNAVNPIMLWFDRFLIAAIISVSAAAFYAIPNEIVIRLTVIPYALLSVLFPAFSTANTHDSKRVEILWQATLRYIFIAQFPLVLVLIAFAPEGLHLWLGRDFAQHSSFLSRCLLSAILVNSVATVPYAHLQSIGRPDITAKLQVGELIVYVGILFYLTRRFGINGTAVAWFLRMTFEAVFLFSVSRRFLPESKLAITQLGWMLASAMGLFVLVSSVPQFGIRVFITLISGVAGTSAIWVWMFSSKERDFLVTSIVGKHSLGG